MNYMDVKTATAKDALNQIEDKKYVAAMKQERFTHFFKIGAAFYKKHVKVLSQMLTPHKEVI